MTPIYKVCSLPVVCHYEDTNNNEVHFSPRSITIAVCKDNKNNWEAKIDTIIIANDGLGHKSPE